MSVWKKKIVPKERARSSGRVTFPMKLIQTGIVKPMMIHELPHPTNRAMMSSHCPGRSARANQSARSSHGIATTAWRMITARFRWVRPLVKWAAKMPETPVTSSHMTGSAPMTVFEAPS